MFKDWYLAVFALVAALVVLGYAVIASVNLTEAFHNSDLRTFSVDCIDKGGRASYNSAEELVCLKDGQILDIYRR